MDMLRQKDMPHLDELARERSAGFNDRRVEALKDIRVRLQSQPNEFPDLPVAFFLVGFQLLGYTCKTPVKIRRWQ